MWATAGQGGCGKCEFQSIMRSQEESNLADLHHADSYCLNSCRRPKKNRLPPWPKMHLPPASTADSGSSQPHITRTKTGRKLPERSWEPEQNLSQKGHHSTSSKSLLFSDASACERARHGFMHSRKELQIEGLLRQPDLQHKEPSSIPRHTLNTPCMVAQITPEQRTMTVLGIGWPVSTRYLVNLRPRRDPVSKEVNSLSKWHWGLSVGFHAGTDVHIYRTHMNLKRKRLHIPN